MKTIVALAVIVGLALGNSTGYYGWTPERELRYRFESELMTGMPEIRSQWAGLKLAAEVRVQTFADYSLRVQMEKPRFEVINRELSVIAGRPRAGGAGFGAQEVPEEFRRALETPFVLYTKRGVVEKMEVDQSEPVTVINIKKALASKLQMDLTALRRKEVMDNDIIKATAGKAGGLEDGSVTEQGGFFTTEEASVTGDCETLYSIHAMTDAQAHQRESRWEEEEKELRQAGVFDGPVSEGKRLCEGKRYFEVTKTKNFDNCRVRPQFIVWTGMKTGCDRSKSSCKDMFTHMSSTNYILCGESTSEFVIRRATTTNAIVSNPAGWVTEEKMVSNARVTLFLLSKAGISQPMEKPRQPKVEKSLVFVYPKNLDITTTEGATRQVEIGQDDEFAPIMDMPDMTSGSRLLPIRIPTEELVVKVAEECRKIADDVMEKTQSCANKKDVAGCISMIVKYMRPMSLDALRKIESLVNGGGRNGGRNGDGGGDKASEIFYQSLAIVGSNPAIALLREKVERRELTQEFGAATAGYVVANAIRNMRTPTPEAFKAALEMVQKFQSYISMSKSSEGSFETQSYYSALLELSNVVHNACIDPSTAYTQFPVRIYGKFCDESSSFITQEYIPYLAKELEKRIAEPESESNSSSADVAEKFALISALGKTGHKDVISVLSKVIEADGEGARYPMVRSFAVYALKRLAKAKPALVRPALLALIDNPAENTEVRIAAIAVLPWAQPEVEELQKVAARSWFEPSKQVASFLYSTFKTLVETEIPELKPVGVKVRTLLHHVKPFQTGIQFSRSLHSQRFIDYIRTSVNSVVHYVVTEDSALPSRLSLVNRLAGGLWEVKGLSFAIYSQGMDKVLDEVLDNLGYKSEESEKVRDELRAINEQLHIESRRDSDLVRGGDKREYLSVVQTHSMGIDSIFTLNKRTWSNVLERVSQVMRNGPEGVLGDKHIQMIRLQNLITAERMGPTAAGFLLYARRSMPVAAAYKGEVSTDGKSAQVELSAVANIKIERTLGVFSPFRKQFVGTGLEMSIHAAANGLVKAETSYSNGEILFSIEKPTKVNEDIELLHAFIKPYTVAKDMSRFIPLDNDPSVKPILSGNPLKKMEFNVGQRFGVDTPLTVETDYKRFDEGFLLELFRKQSLGSFVNDMAMVPSVRWLSIKLVWKPQASETKKIQTRVSFMNGKPLFENLRNHLKMSRGQPASFEINGRPVEFAHEEELENACNRYRGRNTDASKRCLSLRLEELRSVDNKVEAVCEELANKEYENEAERNQCRRAVQVCRKAEEICREAQDTAEDSNDNGSHARHGPHHRLADQEKSEICTQRANECRSRRFIAHRLAKTLRNKLTNNARRNELRDEMADNPLRNKRMAENALRDELADNPLRNRRLNENALRNELADNALRNRRLNNNALRNKLADSDDDEDDSDSEIYGAGLNFETTLHHENNYQVRRALEAMAIMGSKSKLSKTKAIFDMAFTSDHGLTYEVEAQFENLKPLLNYRWSIDELIGEPVQMTTTWEMTYGRRGGDKKTLRVDGQWEKSEEQKKFVRASAEYKKCQEELHRGRPLSSVCMATRHHAASLDRIHFQASVPRSFRDWVVARKAAALAQSFLQYNVEFLETSRVSDSDRFEGRIGFNPRGDSFDLEIASPTRVAFKDVRLGGPFRGLMPFSARNEIPTRILQRLSRSQEPASCRMEPNWVTTFDNMTYKYELNDCQHLLFKDCSGRRPLAVVAEGTGSSKRDVKAIMGTDVVILNWGDRSHIGGRVVIKVNGEEVQVEAGKPMVKRSPKSGRVVLEIVRAMDNVVSVRNPVEGLEVYFDGLRVEIIAPLNLHNRACGLCGDLNLENTADLKTPKNCIMEEQRFNAYTYMMTGGGSNSNNSSGRRTGGGGQECTGIPSQDREAYHKALETCARPKAILTPVKTIFAVAKDILSRPLVAKHLYKKEVNRACFSKRRVLVCPEGFMPARMVEDNLAFTCLTWPSSKAQQFLERSKAGDIVDEILVLPTKFTERHSVPTSCVKQSSGNVDNVNNVDNEQEWRRANNMNANRRH